MAYAWFTGVWSEESVGEFHVCCHPRWRGRWVTRRVLKFVLEEARMRYSKVLAIHGDPTLASALRKAGFEQKSPHVHILTLE